MGKRKTQKTKSTPKPNPKPTIGFDIILAVVFFAIPMGWSMSGFQPHIGLACVFWLAAFLAAAHAFWVHPVIESKKIKSAIIFIALVGTCVVLKAPVTKEYRREHAPPSFIFVNTGVWLNGNTWDFIVQHRGLEPNHHVQILFVDAIRQDQLTRGKNYISAEDIEKYQHIYNYSEIDPKGREGIFSTQLLWTPTNPEHEIYGIDITSTERHVHESLKVERIDNKWLEDIQVKDSETGEILLDCQDGGFPNSRSAPQCFPNLIKEE